jgi:hypothetical protein
LREPVLDLVVMGCTAGIATDEEDGSGSGRGGADAVTGDKVVGFECERSGESAFSVGMDKVGVGEAGYAGGASAGGMYEEDISGEESNMSLSVGMDKVGVGEVALVEGGVESGLWLCTSAECVGEGGGNSGKVDREGLTGNVKGRSLVAHT